MPKATASHILVPSEEQARDLKKQIEESGAEFADLAREHSQCPSKAQGGLLGEFTQGQMVPEFDEVVFGELPEGQVSEPVKTQFGYHLVQVHERSA